MRVGLVQLTSRPDSTESLATCRRLGLEAAEGGARWILFPESAPFLGRDREMGEVGEALDGPSVQAFARLAEETGCWITLGSFAESSEDPGRTYNTQVMLAPSGEIRAVYRKVHLFDADVEGGQSLRESDYSMAGDEAVVVPIEIDGETIRVGLSICYDLRFPELYRELAAAGAQVLTAPSAFTLQTGRDHWHPLLQARAIENQCYVLAPNQWGNHIGSRWSYGHSVAYDPWGRQLACAPDRECAILADLDFDYLRDVRRRIPCLSHRRIGVSSGAND